MCGGLVAVFPKVIRPCAWLKPASTRSNGMDTVMQAGFIFTLRPTAASYNLYSQLWKDCELGKFFSPAHWDCAPPLSHARVYAIELASWGLEGRILIR